MVDDKNLCCGSVRKKVRHALVDQGRRMSPRICSIPESKRPNYGPNNKRRMEAWKDKDSEKQLNLENLVHILQGLYTDMASVSERRKTVKSKKVALPSIGFYNPLLDKFGMGTFLKVKETLRLLNLYQLHSIEVICFHKCSAQLLTVFGFKTFVKSYASKKFCRTCLSQSFRCLLHGHGFVCD